MSKLEVKLLKPEKIIKETLERIGIANRKDRKIYPSCYLIQENGKNYLCHFKELLKVPTMDESDIKRKNTIVWLLARWNMIALPLTEKHQQPKNILEKKIFILTKQQMREEKWTCVHKLHQTPRPNT